MVTHLPKVSKVDDIGEFRLISLLLLEKLMCGQLLENIYRRAESTFSAIDDFLITY